jgi:hypothetical protein
MARRASSLLLLSAAVLWTGGCAVDPYCLNCGDQNSHLDAGHADGGDAGDSGIARDGGDTGPVDSGEHDMAVPDGCTVGATEICNMFDDDCDGMVDEGIDVTRDVDNCGSCGHRCTYAHAFADCTASTCSMTGCAADYYDINMSDADGCEYRCSNTGAEVCDRRDNNCNGMIDEGFDLASDPMNCGVCGRSCNVAHATASCAAAMCTIGTCDAGFYDIDGNPLNGCEYACTPTGPETCNLVDDNCDGNIDEGDPGGGATCGSSTGACRQGTQHCVSGGIVCQGGVTPMAELCNNIDDDCDGTVDNGNPGGGLACGSGVGQCVPGRQMCVAGTLSCMGQVGPVTETCNGLDDDCDGTVDNGNPGGGGSCGSSTGACMAGTLMCSGGALTCAGAVGPTLETCNMIDDDCNGVVDDGFNLTSDIRNCGMCGRSCSFANAVAQCSMGTCAIAACLPGFVNLDGNAANGCEYSCTFTSSVETCNGADDNCNGMVDEGLTPPSFFCRANGVCAGTMPTCGGSMGWQCSYPATYQATETRCDGLDNDCNGVVDDPYPTRGQACTNGEVGACSRGGMYVCNAAGTGVMCNAPASGGGTAETCNGIDDNCDGMVDNGTSARGTWVRVRPAGGTGPTDYWIMSYEASRPDSTASVVGALSNAVCSDPNRQPWVNVTPVEAAAACATVGGSLCTEAQWQRACETAAATACTWEQAAACTTYSAGTCNDFNNDVNTSMAGIQNGVLPTRSMPMCSGTWTVAGSTGTIFDMSGNVREWAAPRSAGVNPLRGGGFQDIQGGTTCQFNFSVGGNTIRFPNTGFRCCRTSAP